MQGESPTYILNEDTQPVIRAIGVSHTACKDEFRQNLRSHSCTAGVYFNFYIPYTTGGHYKGVPLSPFFYASSGWCFRISHIVVYRAQNLLTMPTVGHSQCLRLASSSEWHHDFSSDVGRLIACRHHRHATTRRIQYPSLMPHAISFFGELCRAPCAVHYYKLSPYTRYFLF